jgi:pilus assembly protein CpaC
MQTTYAATITATALCLAAFSSLAQAPAPARPGAAKPVAAEPQTAKPVVREITAPAPSAGEITDVVMYVGEVKTLPVRNVTRVAVGNGRLLTANVLDSEVLLLGEAPGDTSLFMWLKGGTIQRYKVRITGTDVNDNFTQLRAILGDLPGIRLERVGDAVVVSGNTSKVNLQRIEATLKAFPRVLNLAREEEVTLKRMVYMKVQIMEFKKTALENLGVDWQTNIVGPAGALTADAIGNRLFRYAPQTQDPTFTPGQGAAVALSTASQPLRGYLGIASVITSRLNLAVQNGDAWILASPELSTRSGGEAKFLAGGQVPLPTVSATGQSSVTFKDYGIRMTLKPNVDDANNIAASLETELSAIDPSVTVQGIPGFTTRQTNSEINVKSGQTIVISGLVNQNLANTIDKFPFLGDVPVLGALFKSTNFTAGRTDLVIFVTPTVVDAASTANQQRLEKSKDMRDRFDGFLGKKGIVD